MMVLNGLESKLHYVTAEGLEELRRLLKELKQNRAEVAAEVRSLASQSSNVLADPLQSLSYGKAEELSEQIARLERILGSAKVITKPVLKERVQLGSQVVVKIGGVEHGYRLVGSLEADPAKGKLSNESPLGRLLLGKQVNDRLELTVRHKPVVAVIVRID